MKMRSADLAAITVLLREQAVLPQVRAVLHRAEVLWEQLRYVH